jgi:GT2 family glycosyltransferase
MAVVAGKPELSVVVCTHNRGPLLAQTLNDVAAALARTPASSEIVVVDDASIEDMTTTVRRACPQATVARHRHNRGAAAARNTGALVAAGHWLLFVDDDVSPEPGAIAALWACRDPDACLVPVVRNLDGSILNAVRCYWRLGELAAQHLDEPIADVCYPVGACLLLERSLFDRTGGFDERIRPNYVEDDAFGADLRRLGAPIRMVADAVVRHDQHGGDASDERRLAISAVQHHHRWVFYAVAARGWRRVLALAVGVPRSVQEAMRLRSVIPIQGYLRTLWRLPELLRAKPPIGALEDRAEFVRAPNPLQRQGPTL